MSGAGAGLPPGFSPELWEGWSPIQNEGVARFTGEAWLIRVQRIFSWLFICYSGIYLARVCFSEQSAIDAVNRYAAKNGGWLGIE